ncbi:MAG: glycosyltransferase family 4 protein [Pelotomaculum sp.]|jgi:glycosyltransferase involved in cell wall biosynthesis
MNKKFTCTIIGSLGRNRAVADGQTIKTKILYEEILAERLYDEVNIVDMSDRKGRGFSIFLQIIYAFFWSDHIIFSVSSNGMRVLYPMLYYMNHIFKKAIIQVTIGGGLPKRTQKNPKWIKYMNSFGKNFVETEKMRVALEEQGLNNVDVIPNFKKFSLNADEIKQKRKKVFNEQRKKICTFSRVCETKGIEDAVEAVKLINSRLGFDGYQLTIYGKIDDEYKSRFEEIKREFPSCVVYGGVVPYDLCVSTISDYYIMLFPTYHPGEGFPATIIDAFYAGVPVLASSWNYNGDILSDGKTGRLFPARDINAIVDLLAEYYYKPDEIYKMSLACMNEVAKYQPDVALKPLADFVHDRIAKKIYGLVCANHDVADHYYEIINMAANRCGYKFETIENLACASDSAKNDYFLAGTVVDAVRLYLRGRKNIIIWVQGILPEESFMRNNKIMNKIVLELLERFALRKAKMVLFVSNEMKSHYEAKYAIDFSGRHYIMPCYTRLDEVLYTAQKYKVPSFTYVGSLTVWQKFDDVLEIYAEIKKNLKNAELFIFTREVELANQKVQAMGIEGCHINSVSQEELDRHLANIKYGFVIRDVCAVNRVATPTKISTYINCGVIPIYSDAVGFINEILQMTQFKICIDGKRAATNIIQFEDKTVDYEQIRKEYQAILIKYYSDKKHEEKLAAALTKVIG